jgi:Arc/MetJ family transcription regulator
MKKRRVTLNLDEDVVEALEALGARSLSTAANDALRRAVAAEAHRAAMLRWLDDLDAEHGSATPEEVEAIEELLDGLEAARGQEEAGAA